MWCVLWIAMASAHRTYPMGFGVHVLFSIFHRSLTPSRALCALAQWYRYAGYIPYVDDSSFNYAIVLLLIYWLSLKFIVWTCSVYAETLPWYCVICLFFGLCCPYFYFHAILSFLHFLCDFMIIWHFYKPVIAVLLVPRCSHCALSDIVMYSTIRYSLKFCYLHNYSFIHLCLYVIFELDSEHILSHHVDPSFVTFFMYKWCVNILSFIGTFISSSTFVPLLHCDVVILVNGYISLGMTWYSVYFAHATLSFRLTCANVQLYYYASCTASIVFCVESAFF